MRRRNIKNAKERIALYNQFVIFEPRQHLGLWHQLFSNDNPLHLEIGMGKGKFILEKALKNPNINYLGMEKFDSIMLVAIERNLDQIPANLKFMVYDALELDQVFSPNEIDKIYLNFSDPWPKSAHEKRRLTSKRFLQLYQAILPLGGMIEFKTDNARFFEYSIMSFLNQQWRLLDFSVDLHARSEEIITTEYEEKFISQGMSIYYLKVQKDG